MSTFPLYNLLNRDIPDKDLTVEQKHEMLEMISQLKGVSIEHLFALIRKYYVDHTKENYRLVDIPYGNKTDDNIVFDLDNFPNPLKHLLYRFCKLTLNRIS